MIELRAERPFLPDAPPRREATPLPEAVLLRAYGASGAFAIARVLPCVCGGSVAADPADPAPGVADHQLDERHRAWRGRKGL